MGGQTLLDCKLFLCLAVLHLPPVPARRAQAKERRRLVPAAGLHLHLVDLPRAAFAAFQQTVGDDRGLRCGHGGRRLRRHGRHDRLERERRVSTAQAADDPAVVVGAAECPRFLFKRRAAALRYFPRPGQRQQSALPEFGKPAALFRPSWHGCVWVPGGCRHEGRENVWTNQTLVL